MAPGRKASSTGAVKKWHANTFKYGMPLYGVAWPEGKYVYVCGGGGAASSGIKNRLVIAKCKRGCLTDQIGEYNFGQDCPTRMVASPDGKSLVISMGNGGIKRLEVDNSDKKRPRVAEVSGSLYERVSSIKGNIKALAFDATCSHLAIGSAEGTLHVLHWPSMKPALELSGETQLAHGVRDLDFSRAGPVLALVLEDGSLELHNWSKHALLTRMAPGKEKLRGERLVLETSPNTTLVHHLPTGMEGVSFFRVLFSRIRGSSDMFALMNHRATGAWLTVWKGAGVQPADVALVRQARVNKDAGTAFAVSKDSSLLAVGSSEGALLLVRTKDLQAVARVPRAHLVFATCAAFADSAALAGHQVLSGSADASAYVLEAKPTRRNYKRAVMLCFFAIAFILLAFLLAVRITKTTGHFHVWSVLLDKLGLPNFIETKKRAWEQAQRDLFQRQVWQERQQEAAEHADWQQPEASRQAWAQPEGDYVGQGQYSWQGQYGSQEQHVGHTEL